MNNSRYLVAAAAILALATGGVSIAQAAPSPMDGASAMPMQSSASPRASIKPSHVKRSAPAHQGTNDGQKAASSKSPAPHASIKPSHVMRPAPAHEGTSYGQMAAPSKSPAPHASIKPSHVMQPAPAHQGSSDGQMAPSGSPTP
jgi:hypothetical protein